MSSFDKRGDSFENKFARDEALQFKAMARRNKLLGLWAAEKLGKNAAEAEAAKTTAAITTSIFFSPVVRYLVILLADKIR